jgi:hypothetical protein
MRIQHDLWAAIRLIVQVHRLGDEKTATLEARMFDRGGHVAADSSETHGEELFGRASALLSTC